MRIGRSGLRAVALLIGLATGGSSAPGLDTAPIARLLDRAEDLLMASGAGLARDAAEEALSRARARGDLRLEVAALARLASALDEMGEREASADRFAEAGALAAEVDEPEIEALLLIELGHTAWKRADYDRASERGERALVLAERASTPVEQAAALRLLGRVAVKRGNYDEAAARAGRALALAEVAGDRRGTALAHEDLGFVDLDRRRLAAALDHYRRALSLHAEEANVAGRVRALLHVAIVLLTQGNGDDALASTDRALAVAGGDGGDAASQAWARYLRGQALRALERFDEARAELERALVTRREQHDARGEAWLLGRLGQLAAEQERPAEALARYREALAIWRRLDDWRAAAWFLLEAARASDRIGETERARELYHAAIEAAERIELPYRSLALGGLARLEAREGEREAALVDGQRAVDAANATGNLEMIWRALYDLAEVELAFDRRREALAHLRSALAAIERLRAEAVPTDRSKRAEIADRQVVFARAVGLLVDSGLPAEALEVAERARARASLDLFASRGERAGTERAGALDGVDLEAVPSPRHVETPPVAMLIGVARARGITAIEYFVGDGRLFAWVVGADQPLRVVATPLDPTHLDRLVEQLRRGLRGAPAEPREGEPATLGPAQLRATLRELDRLLIEPIARWLPRQREQVVTIVPHGRLFLLSFAALLDADGSYLVEKHALSYVPALSLLAWTDREPAATVADRRALVVGNPAMPPVPGRDRVLEALPGAEREALAVARSLGGAGRAVVLTGRGANEPEVRRLAARAPILHLATHGLLRDDAPLDSFVALAPAGVPDVGGDSAASDGRWTMAEIQDGRLGADLVTLSACDTGLGPVSGDGVLGLSRAFLVAGARSALVSLWRVADEVAFFQMERFYRELAPGADRAGALRTAQLATLAALRARELRTPSGRPIPESPAYWAPFVLVGETR
ncbi:MAG: CHAT domain-containing protein [Thermoanaerobaculia bacterium]|nr:CHAT domain-containing protein [Thermoanaerobaculia bacterium]